MAKRKKAKKAKKKKAKAKSRKIKPIEDADGKLDYQSEPVDGLEPDAPSPRRAVKVPGKKRKPKYDLARARTIIFGPPKIGKSTLASQFPGPWFLATEAGQDWLNVYEPTVIESWEDFLNVCAYIEEEKPKKFGDGKPIKTIVIDTVDLLFKMCHDDTCVTLGVNSPSDLDYGRGWSALSDEFLRVIAKMARWPYGLVFISHSKEKQVKSKARKIDIIQPAIMTTGFKVLLAAVDIVLYCSMDEQAEYDDEGEVTGVITEERIIRCQPASNIIAGDRTGRLPDTMPMSYKELVKHFPATGK